LGSGAGKKQEVTRQAEGNFKSLKVGSAFGLSAALDRLNIHLLVLSILSMLVLNMLMSSDSAGR
jgi:hypothetical protein